MYDLQENTSIGSETVVVWKMVLRYGNEAEKKRKVELYVKRGRERVVRIEIKSKYGSQVKKNRLKNKKRRVENWENRKNVKERVVE